AGSNDKDLGDAAGKAAGDRLEELTARPMSELDALLNLATPGLGVDKPRAEAIVGHFGKIQKGNDPLGLLPNVKVPEHLLERIKTSPSSNERDACEGQTQAGTLYYIISNLVSQNLGNELCLDEGVCSWQTVREHPGVPENEWWMYEAEHIVRRYAREVVTTK